mmetsp:Transcript_4751/g.8137  ORF Transcript_4751/g.8137 Transcript_4751/m.8137 type:complete len:200 (-) Transcript_4751:288-887(-)
MSKSRLLSMLPLFFSTKSSARWPEKDEGRGPTSFDDWVPSLLKGKLNGPGATRIRRIPPPFMPARASSNAGITDPSPNVNLNKLPSSPPNAPPLVRSFASMMRPRWMVYPAQSTTTFLPNSAGVPSPMRTSRYCKPDGVEVKSGYVWKSVNTCFSTASTLPTSTPKKATPPPTDNTNARLPQPYLSASACAVPFFSTLN